MKDFFKTMLAVICGILALELIYGIFAGIAFASLIAAGFSGSSAPDAKGILDMDLSKIVITEQKNPNDFSSLASFQSDLEVKQVALRDAVIALKTAAADPSIKMVFLRPDGVSAGMADIQELHKALAAFRESGKPVIAFTESPGNAAYYLATAADKIYMSSAKGATYTLVGISGRMIFLKDVLDKLGINYQLIRHGKYKSAGEMYIRSSASEANREQNRVMIKSAWDNFAGDICDARGIAPEKFNALIDNLSLCFPEDFLKEGLVDELLDRTALVNKLCLLYGVEEEEDLSISSFADYANKLSETANTLRSVSKQPAVAVLYADGEIVDGSGYKGVAGDRFVREIEKIRKDNSVKAVVLRVNSPGGSVSASAKIKDALQKLDAEKPVVASFGNYAASGGYWISAGCRRIYASPNTVTGSIGVFSLLPEFSRTAKKIGINVETVGSNKHSDMFTLMRPFDKEETAYFQSSVEDIYDTFVNLVADGRGIAAEKVDEIAQGRVWMGSDALKLDLVDLNGTLEDAIADAASMAGLVSTSDYMVKSYPAPLTIAEQILLALGQNTQEPSILSGTPFEVLGNTLTESPAPEKVYARMPYSLEIR